MTKEKLIPVIFLFFVVFQPVLKCAETKGFGFIKSALVMEGITDSSKILIYRNQYESLIKSIVDKIDRTDDVYDQNEDIFKFLHKNYLLKYEEITKVSIIFDKKFYNCVTASVLYYAICLDLDFNTKIYSTPYHVFLKVYENNKPFRIDLTDPVDGFDAKENKKNVMDNLLLNKMITEEELKTRGIDSIYNDFVIETKVITPNNLLQVVKSNLAIKDNDDKKYNEAFKKIYEAMKMDPKFSDIQHGFIYIWANAVDEFSKTNDLEKIDSLLNAALSFSDYSEDYKKTIVSVASDLLLNYIREMKPYSNIDTIYRRCERKFGKELFFDTEMGSAKINLEIYHAYELIKKGFYEEGYEIGKKLYYKYNKQEGKIQDCYIGFTQTYIEYLGQNEEYEEAIAKADTLLKQIPDYPSVQEFYINTIIHCTSSGYFAKNPAMSEKLLLKAAAIKPGSVKAKKTMAALYDNFAMEMVRKKDYKKALKYAQDGLKYDENNSALMRDIELIKPLIK